eukprot:6213521-Pleurochrysis_carterae.AAC.1
MGASCQRLDNSQRKQAEKKPAGQFNVFGTSALVCTCSLVFISLSARSLARSSRSAASCHQANKPCNRAMRNEKKQQSPTSLGLLSTSAFTRDTQADDMLNTDKRRTSMSRFFLRSAPSYVARLALSAD